MDSEQSKIWCCVIALVIGNFFSATCLEILAPFYQEVAESKGLKRSEYALVFGIYSLGMIIMSPIIGSNLQTMGVRNTINVGLVTMGTSTALFAILDKVDNKDAFLALSLSLRILAACGSAGFQIASISLCAMMFSENIPLLFSIIDTTIGLGEIVGPFIGGLLYTLGGFFLPFVTLGITLILATVLVELLLPLFNVASQETQDKPSLRNITKVPNVLTILYVVVCAASGESFLFPLLEPHLRDFRLNSTEMGGPFLVSGGSYMVCAVIFGKICTIFQPKRIYFIGAILTIIAFVIIGPLPFLPLEKTKTTAIVALGILGIGMAAQVVSSFTEVLHIVISFGFPDTTGTYGLISGVTAQNESPLIANPGIRNGPAQNESPFTPAE